MKKTILAFLLLLLSPLSTSCNGWVIQRGPFNPPTPFLPATNTPSIVTATPVVIAASATSTVQVQIPTPTSLPFITATTVPARELSYPPSASSSSWKGRLTAMSSTAWMAGAFKNSSGMTRS